MELSSYLHQLLHRHDCVIVPGLGGFVCASKKLEFNPRAGYIQPARKTVAFNQNLTGNDGLLANFIAEEKKIDFTLATQQIEGWADTIKQQLEQGQTVNMRGIGSFSHNEEKNTVFVPEPTANFLPETYGLQKLVLKPQADGMETTVAETPAVAKKDESKATPPAKKSRRHPIPLPAGSEPQVKERKKGKSWLRRIPYIILVLLLVAGFFVVRNYPQHFKFDFGSLFPSDAPAPKKETVKPQTPPTSPDKVTAEKESPAAKSIQNETHAQPPVDTKTTETAQTDSVFYIIAGAFSSGQNASNLKTDLEQKGYEPVIINIPGSSLYRVGYRQYTTRKEAEGRLAAVRRDAKNPAAWVLAVKK